MKLKKEKIEQLKGRVLKVGGKQFLRLGNKAIPISGFDTKGNAIVAGVWSEEKINENGGQDCTVHVPCLKIESKPKKTIVGKMRSIFSKPFLFIFDMKKKENNSEIKK
jgi:hypothetical protein